MRRLLAGGLGAVLVASGALLAIPGAGPASAAIDLTDSALTKSGDGEFADLKVTLSQSEGLVNQIIKITWEGGKPTTPGFGDFYIDYLQIMQCWGGTPEDGPPREQCQFGTKKASGGGNNSASRQMNIGSIVDPLETKYEEYADDLNAYIPFRSVSGKETRGRYSEFFDKQTSNEVDFARTRADGSGENYFEVQTGIEAPGLGCGQDYDGEAPLCWIVVVPRGDTEVDGSVRGNTGANILETSPLMESNWANRIVFPITFQPIGSNCSFGASEVPLLGSDRVEEAVTKWQPALCQQNGENFSYTILPDQVARQKLTGDKSDLVFINYPLPAEQADPTRPITYAPVALSGLTIAFNVERQSPTLAKPEVRERDGERVEDIKLNPRLVAKLLTQTYRYDTAPKSDNTEGNPWDLAQDPEFLEINPQFKELKFPALGHMITTLGETDSARLVWEWVWGDKDARNFLKGKPDPWGTKVNPNYVDANFPRTDYPRTDNVCVTYGDRPVALCTFDLFPYAGDLSAAARAASRGDTMSRGQYDPTKLPPGYGRTPPQEPGKRAMIVITDTALTDRFALTPAALLNAAGDYVLPTDGTLRKAADEAKATGVAGVKQPDPTAKVKGAYPLTSFTYAATTPATLSDDQAASYADFLTYVATDGQTPGDEIGRLPFGYVPLSAAEIKAVEKAADVVVATAGEVLPAPEPTDPPAGGSDTTGTVDTTTDTSTTDTSYTDTSYTDTSYTDTSYTDTSYTDTTVSETSTAGDGGETVVDQVTTEETVVEETTVTETVEAPSMTTTAIEAIPTPASPVGVIRYVAVMLLIAGGLALLAGALLAQRLVRRSSPIPS